MLTYKLIEKGNPSDKEAPKKLYASHVSKGKKSLTQIAADIEKISSLSRGDISSVLQNVVDQVPIYLLDGQSVSLGELGTFRISFSSEGVDTPDAFNVNKIKNIKIIFTPGMKIKEAIGRASFEKGE
jgi:predicted histone-like DNA-binding protein